MISSSRQQILQRVLALGQRQHSSAAIAITATTTSTRCLTTSTMSTSSTPTKKNAAQQQQHGNVAGDRRSVNTEAISVDNNEASSYHHHHVHHPMDRHHEDGQYLARQFGYRTIVPTMDMGMTTSTTATMDSYFSAMKDYGYQCEYTTAAPTCSTLGSSSLSMMSGIVGSNDDSAEYHRSHDAVLEQIVIDDVDEDSNPIVMA